MDNNATSRRDSDRGPTPSQKRKIRVESPHLSATQEDAEEDDDDVTNVSQRSGRLPPAARLAFESPVLRQGDITQPTTPVSDEEATSSAYYSVLRQRVLKYTRLQQTDEREAEAARLVPALVRLFPLAAAINIVRDFSLPVNGVATEDVLNAPFRTASVWRRALE